MRGLLQRTWLQRGLPAGLLWPFSLLYRLLVALHKAAYELGLRQRQRLGVPVIVVGNVVAGGASTPGDVGDEPLLMRRATACPVFVARQRAGAGRALLAAHPQVNLLICDDGLQHHGLQRDVEVVVFSDAGIGNGWLLPAGPLREPWPRRADLVLNSGLQPCLPGYRAVRRLGDEAIGRDGTRVPLQTLAGQRLGALAGIAEPQQFFAMLQARGLTLIQTRPLPDHHDFAAAPPVLDPALTWLCTEKDAAKLWPVHPGALAVPLLFRPEDGFLAALDQLLSNDGNQTA